MKATFAELDRGKPVIRRVPLSANIDARLVAYAKYLGAENGQVIAPEELIELMLARFMAGDRMFKQAQRHGRSARGWRKRGLAGPRREPMASRKPRVRTVEPRWRD